MAGSGVGVTTRQFSNGDCVYQQDYLLEIRFADRRRVLSTSAYQGGIREDLRCVFNYDMSYGKTRQCELLAPSMEEHMRLVAQKLKLPRESSGLCTAAQIWNTAICQETWEGVTVTALVTAGIDENGGRAGDPASWQEKDGVLGLPVGTINLLLHFNCDIPQGVLAGALLTATEAKCAAIQELQLPSKVSAGLATGSGTDGAILICDPGSSRQFTDTGKHSKMGEMIGRAVYRGVREALYKQTKASPERLHNALRLLGRFGLTENLLCRGMNGEERERIIELCCEEEVWMTALLCAHLLDQVQWKVCTMEQAVRIAERVFPIEENDLLGSFVKWMINKRRNIT